jgi:hypothetical protein
VSQAGLGVLEDSRQKKEITEDTSPHQCIAPGKGIFRVEMNPDENISDGMRLQRFASRFHIK